MAFVNEVRLSGRAVKDAVMGSGPYRFSIAPLRRNKTQGATILQLLVRARGAWVPAPELARVALQYGRAIHGLRKLGFSIENRVETGDGGVRRGYFRLATATHVNPIHGEGAARVAKPTAATTESLFDQGAMSPVCRPPNLADELSRDERARQRRADGRHV